VLNTPDLDNPKPPTSSGPGDSGESTPGFSLRTADQTLGKLTPIPNGQAENIASNPIEPETDLDPISAISGAEFVKPERFDAVKLYIHPNIDNREDIIKQFKENYITKENKVKLIIVNERFLEKNVGSDDKTQVEVSFEKYE
jgi:hypothetical protein